MKEKSIAIIGVGNLGKRHLQSMMELVENYNIYAIEINEESINNLKIEFPNVFFSSSISDLPNEIEVVVLSTNSNIRRQVFEKLIEQSIVKNILFEKVLFQKTEDYFYVEKKIIENNINAWVNCARREWDSYRTLKEELDGYKEMYLSATGGNWGLACNGIHMLDLVEYISGKKIGDLDINLLNSGFVNSKRKGFYEVFGTIAGKAGESASFSLTCMESEIPFQIQIYTESSRYIINETHNKIYFSSKDTDWEWKERDFKQTYQSQMTGRVIRSIIERGNCNLPNYKDSMELHLKYITPLIRFFKENGWEAESCPIT